MSKDNLFCKDCKEFFLHDPKHMIGICRIRGINMNLDDSNTCVFSTRPDNIVDRIDKIKEEINKADLPQGDYFDLEKFWKIVRDEDLSFNDVFEGFAQAMNTLVNIRAILNNEE